MTTIKDKPVHVVRLGSIRAGIWKNDAESGSWYNTRFSRIYKEGDEWKAADSFGRDDLLVVAKVADMAHSWIHDQKQEEKEQQGKALANKEGPALEVRNG